MSSFLVKIIMCTVCDVTQVTCPIPGKLNLYGLHYPVF